MSDGVGRIGRRLDRLGVVIAALIAVTTWALPFATFRPNRIVSGRGLNLVHALEPVAVTLGLAVFAAVALLALGRSRPALRLGAAGIGLAVLCLLIGQVPAHVVPAGNALARVAPASGFWLLFLAFAIMAADAIARLSLGPLARVAILGIGVAAGLALLASGAWNGLSIMREFANNADGFWREGGTHVALALGSLAAAIAVGLPLGIACHRSATLSRLTLPVLNIVQTVPSIAMYGLMMVPLGLLAANVPLAAALGIRGIGPAPAVIALFLYSLLPVVANVALGLAQVPATVVEAANGMGMTRTQRLFQVELPLALPLVLTGIRIVLVQNIGLVTIAALIGGGGFGTFVFQGLGQSATDLVLLGAVPTIALAFAAAILLDAAVDLAKGQHA